jgi:arsenite-transporting ATPase
MSVKMGKHTRELFYLGKGGTGKTTVSALTAIALADRNYRVALISMDPAHNVFDIFRVRSLRSEYDVDANLQLEEIDPEKWLKKYLQAIELQISRSYKYLTALSLEKNLQIMRYSPGLEEYALLYAYRTLKEKFKDFDFLIVDMPPTALALRFFALPRLSQVWLKHLIGIRKTILKKMNIIEDVHRLESKAGSDNILNKLNILHEEHQVIETAFSDPARTSMFVILNNDELSLAESEDIKKKFGETGLTVTGYILNKAKTNEYMGNYRDKFSGQLLARLESSPIELIGPDTLRYYASGQNFQAFISGICDQR